VTNKGSSLVPYGTLSPYDTLISNNQCFTAVLQGDGQFVVYEGTIFDPNQVRWTSGVGGPDGGPYQAVLQGDGQFVVYKGTLFDPNQILWLNGVGGPDGQPYLAIMQEDGNFVVYNAAQALWATNTPWNLAKVDLSNVTYDLSHAVLSNPQIQNQDVRTLTNNTGVEQTETFTFECDYTETQSWSTTWGVKIGVQLSIKAGISIIADGQVKISTEVSWSTTSGGTQSVTKKYTDSIPVKIPPHTQVACKAVASTATVSIPFSANAIYWDILGRSYSGIYIGTYQGTTAYELQASWTQTNL
jgi:hypothetical protein